MNPTSVIEEEREREREREGIDVFDEYRRFDMVSDLNSMSAFGHLIKLRTRNSARWRIRLSDVNLCYHFAVEPECVPTRDQVERR